MSFVVLPWLLVMPIIDLFVCTISSLQYVRYTIIHRGCLISMNTKHKTRQCTIVMTFASWYGGHWWLTMVFVFAWMILVVMVMASLPVSRPITHDAAPPSATSSTLTHVTPVMVTSVPCVADLHRVGIATMIPMYTAFLFTHALLLFDASVCMVPRTLVAYVIVVTAGGENGGLFLGAFFGKYKPVS